MEGWQWALVLKPFGVFLLCVPGAMIVWWMKRNMPQGLARRILLFSWRV